MCAAVAVLALVVPAQGGVVNAPEVCNQSGKQLCVTVSTYSGATASNPARTGGIRWTWVEWSLRNAGHSTLTHPAVTVSLADVCGVSACAALSSAFVLPATPNVCSASGTSLVCSYGKLAGGKSTAATRIYFRTADAPATGTNISVRGTVKEGDHDAKPCPDDANCDTVTATIANSYEPDANGAASFVLSGKRLHLAANDEFSSFDLTSAASAPFLAQLEVEGHSPSFCFGDVPCFERTLVASTAGAAGFGAANPVVFYARLTPPSGVTKDNLKAIHFYDPVTLQANAATKRFTGPAGSSFARIDGVSFDAGASSVIAAGTYFVVGYQASDGSFKLSHYKGGSPVTPLASGAVTGGPIRVIGDQSDERSTTSCTTSPAAFNFPVPSICVQKVPWSSALDNWVWDTGNGRVGW